MWISRKTGFNIKKGFDICLLLETQNFGWEMKIHLISTVYYPLCIKNTVEDWNGAEPGTIKRASNFCCRDTLE